MQNWCDPSRAAPAITDELTSIVGAHRAEVENKKDEKDAQENTSTRKPTIEYRRIASTLSSQHSSTTPWDLIQENDPASSPGVSNTIAHSYKGKYWSRGAGFEPVPEHDNTGNCSQEISENSDSGSEFSFDSAWNDVQELDQSKNACAPTIAIKPNNEIRDLLLLHEVPSEVIIDVLTSLQLRDNWLAFLSKHFRRTLKDITKKEDVHQDRRFLLLKEVLADFKPYESSLPLSSAKKSAFSDVIGTRPSPSAQPSTANSCPNVPTTSDCLRKPHKDKHSSLATQCCQKKNKKLRAKPPVYIVTSLLTDSSQKTNPSCITLLSKQLGTEPNEHSGLEHFSPSCAKRASEQQSIRSFPVKNNVAAKVVDSFLK